MKRRSILCVLLVLVLVVFSVAQSPVAPPPVPDPLDTSVNPSPRSRPGEAIDELLNRLDTIEKEEALLKKAKEETLAKLKEYLKQQRQRLQKHGIGSVEGGVSFTN